MKIRQTAAWLALPLCLLASAGKAEKNCPSEQELLQALTAEVQPAASLLLSAPETDCRTAARDRGSAVGKVQTVQGTVLIISADGCNASRLEKSLPLPVFTGDTIVIDQSVYDPDTSRRDTKLRLVLGRLRAVVAKMTEKNLYRIQTPAATAGVRGTDFALAVVSPALTVLLTGGGSSAVELTDKKGGSSAVGPLSAACSVCPPAHVGRKALAVLHEIAPELDAAAAADETCWWMRWRCK
ncbi:MAG: FecR domain-containing protein [Candidatus Electronema sp. VV]